MEVFPGSPADRYGVKSGDLIVKINDQETRFLTKEGVGEVLKHCSEADQATIAIVREDTGVASATNHVDPTNEEASKKHRVRFEGDQSSKKQVQQEHPLPVQTTPSPRAPLPGVINYVSGDRLTDSLISKAPKARLCPF